MVDFGLKCGKKGVFWCLYGAGSCVIDTNVLYLLRYKF